MIFNRAENRQRFIKGLGRIPRVLDLCCGMGFWSIGFYREGFDCVGIDIVDVGYPYDLQLQDVHEAQLSPENYDVVVASPPCTEFSELIFLAVAKGQRRPADPEKGMDLVRECWRLIQEAKPQCWALENVRGAVSHIQTLLGPPKLKHRPWYLWGDFPAFLLPQSNLGIKVRTGPNGRLNSDVKFDPLVSWKRARIPLPLSIGLAKACATKLLRGC